jgi:hypothetical protein
MQERAESGDILPDPVVSRFEAELLSALRRKPSQESRLAGCVRELAPFSEQLRGVTAEILEVVIKRGSFERPLYAGCTRALAVLDERRAAPLLARALLTEGAGGLSSLSAACFVSNAGLGDPLARVAATRHPHLVFASEVARLARAESNGEHIANVAPMIKESHRIELCGEVFVPLLWASALPIAIAPALAVLRDSERHLGRWLVLAEIAVRAGDERPALEAQERARVGPSSARAAWTLVAWALAPGSISPPTIRPTVELVARLSDRPSADRDTTFLYRLAARRIPSARPMLESMVKGAGLEDETAIRSALYLIRDYGRSDLQRLLVEATQSTRREAVRGLAAAALFDAGFKELSLELSQPLLKSRQTATAAWAALIVANATSGSELITEPRYRRVQRGWVE